MIIDEDCLYRFISNRISEDDDFVSLLEFVQFEWLSDATVSQFVEEMPPFFDRFNAAIWRRVCARLRNGFRVNCLFRKTKPLDGIISYLTQQSAGNVFQKKIVNVMASSIAENLSLANDCDFGKSLGFLLKNDLFVMISRAALWHTPHCYSVARFEAPQAGWVVESSRDSKV
jgi:hypothetical protein